MSSLHDWPSQEPSDLSRIKPDGPPELPLATAPMVLPSCLTITRTPDLNGLNPDSPPCPSCHCPLGFPLTFICKTVSAFYIVQSSCSAYLMIEYPWHCVINSMFVWSLSLLYFWSWKCIPGILIPHWISILEVFNKHHKSQDLRLLPSYYRVSRRLITTIVGRGIHGTNVSDWGRGTGDRKPHCLWFSRTLPGTGFSCFIQ